MGLGARIKDFLAGRPKEKTQPKAATDNSGTRATRFYGQKYRGGLPFPSPSLVLDSANIRQQVRTLSHNSLQLRSLITSNVNTVISQGLNLAPEPKHELLGITPEAAEIWASDVKSRFELWAMSPKSSRSGKYNFFQAQRLMEKSLDRDGELFVTLSYHNDPSLLNPLRFEILDPDQIRENGYTWTATGAGYGAMNKEGIARNDNGEETSYKVWATDSAGMQKMTEIPKTGRGGRTMMLHAMTEIDYAGQLRGISPYSVCVQDLENILDFTLAQVNKAINQSNLIFTGESDSDDPADNPLKSLPGFDTQPAFGNGPAAKQFGSTPQPDPNAKNVTEESLQPVYNEIPHGNFSRPGSAGVFLGGKQKLKPFPDTAPSQGFNIFVDEYFAFIAAARGESIETVLMRFSNNYSASRATLIMMWRNIEQRRWELDYYVLGPLYEMWLAEELAAGRVCSPGWIDPRLRAAWVSHRYTGTGMPNIDPAKTVKAAKDNISMGAQTIGDYTAECNDSDAKSNRVKLKQELAELRELGVMPWDIKNDDKQGQGKEEEGGEDDD